MPQLFSRNNSTSASSKETQHPAGYAADGNKGTWWQPNSVDLHPSWILDTEKRLCVSEINISFPEEAVCRYKVEISDNRQEWKTIEDIRNNQQKEAARQIKVPELIGRNIRISFENAADESLAEVEVTGKVLD